VDTNERIRQAMKQAMREQGLSHAQLAERLGISQPSVTQILNGQYGNVPRSLLNALDALGLTLEVAKKHDR